MDILLKLSSELDLIWPRLCSVEMNSICSVRLLKERKINKLDGETLVIVLMKYLIKKDLKNKLICHLMTQELCHSMAFLNLMTMIVKLLRV